MKEVLTHNYHYKLIELMMNATSFGVLIANFIAPLISVYLLFPYIPLPILIVGFSLHLIILFSRLYVKKEVLKILNINKLLMQKYIKIVYYLMFFSALLNGIMLWISVFYAIPDITLILVATIVFALSAGALTTASSILIAYLIYILINMSMLISASLYKGGEIFYVFSFMMLVFLIILIVSGIKNYIILRDTVKLEETFSSIFNNSSDGIVIINNNKFENCNLAIIKMFGFSSRSELLTARLDKLSPKYQNDGKLSLLKMAKMTKIASTEGVNSFEWLHTKIDGTEFWCEIVLTKITLKGKNLIHGVWRDISQRKNIEILEIESKKELERRVALEVKNNMAKDRQLLHQSRLAQMGEMIGMIAHQWRQPLSAITTTSSSLQLKLQMGTLTDETIEELTNNINSYTKHLSDTIDDFRNFFKPNKDKEYATYTKLLESVLGIINDSIKSKKIVLTQDMRCTEEFKVYSNELKHVILNLLKNAEDVLVEKKIQNPYINITSYKEQDNFILEIEDNGGGIAEDIIDNIFDPYFSTKIKKDGTGIGLYMSKMIINEHCGGKLSVANTKNGASFKISIHKSV